MMSENNMIIYDPNSPMAKTYKEAANYLLHLSFPQLTKNEIDAAIDWAVAENIMNPMAVLDNNYTKENSEITLLDIANYIINKKPIIASNGTMYKPHGTVPNLIYTLLDGFINDRKKEKKEMFKYPKGSEMYERHQLNQLLLKIDANGFYGCSGMYSCIYYNFYTATAITAQGRSCNSAAALFFEAFLNNNVPFGSFEELLMFIYHVTTETRRFKDSEVLDRDITLEECFFKLIHSTGFGWVPTMRECEILWEMLHSLSQTDINRLFYKNNLFNFADNSQVMKAIIYMLCKLDTPYLDPNECPEIIEEELTIFYDLMYEFVYYDKQIIDRVEKMASLIRSVSIIQDTDSCIISYDGWYNYVLEHTIGVPMMIKSTETDLIKAVEDYKEVMVSFKPVTDYEFINEELIESERLIDPMVIIPQDGLKYSIINILAYCTSKMVNDFMSKYVDNANAQKEGVSCLLSLKNEFTFARALITDAKKHYATKVVLQEGNDIPEDERLDVKGMEAFVKSTINPTVQEKMKRVLYEDILNADEIDQIKLLKDLAMIEREIYDSIIRGEKIYYKPVKVKSMSSYENPMRIQGIKASVVYNALHEPGTEALDLTTQNPVDIIKVEITPRNIEKIKDSNPYVYEKAMELFQIKEFENGIDSIAIPYSEPVPNWVLNFVRISEIINNNIGNFPLESVGLYRGQKTNNYTNLIEF